MSSDPKRLADYGPSLRGVVRDALEAERAVDDTEAARLARIEAKLLAAIGAAPVLGAPPADPPSPVAPPAAPPPVPAAPSTAPGSGASSWLGAKGAIGLGAAAVVIGVALLSRPAETNPAPVSPPSTSILPPTLVTPANEPAAAPTVIKTVSPSELPTVAEPVAKPAPSARETGSASAASGGTDTEEIALLARAHEALRGSPAASLELCREHEKKFANGHFSQEREAVAIEALVYLGRRAEAEKRWSSFRARFPGSSHRVHLESLFSAPEADPAPSAR
ncbi:MAG: hypothetical protein JST00_29615 [Deltaproteobacteria bacterium]|nr:hypothetical protein [Deltaproteobacteria bacterium]